MCNTDGNQKYQGPVIIVKYTQNSINNKVIVDHIKDPKVPGLNKVLHFINLHTR